MCKALARVCVFVLLLGCNASDKTEEAANSSAPSNAVPQSGTAPLAEKTPQQYMAVCITKEAHEGNEYVLTKWLDSKYKAEVYGREHSRKRKGHEVAYKERVKP